MKKIFSLFILLMAVIAFASAQSLNWNGKNGDLLIGPYVQFYYDSSGTATIENISSPSTIFQPSKQNFDYITDLHVVHWLKFNIQNNSDKSLMLELSRVEITSAILYSKDSMGQWQEQKAGYEVKLSQKPSVSHYQVFKLNSATGEYFLRIQSEFNAFVPLTIWEASSFEHMALLQKIWSGVYIGMMIFVLLYNLFLYFSLRRFYFLTYVFVVLCYLAHSVFEGGEIFYFFPGVNFPVIYPRMSMMAPFLVSVFVLSFLNVKAYAPRWAYIFMLIMTLYFGSFGLWQIFLTEHATRMNLNGLHSFINIIQIIIIGIVVGRKNRFGYWLFIPYVLMWAFVFLSIMNLSTGQPPLFMGIPHSNLGLLIEVILLAYLVSWRFKLEQKEKENAKIEAQKQLYIQTKENERIIKDQNILLERKVTERTRDLEQQKLMVEKTNDVLEQTLVDLKSTQAQLIQSEKMASLGELTAGIAHEIQNPLNFVNNFSEVNEELLTEMKDEMVTGNIDDALLLANDAIENQKKIIHHGKRADSIVKGMLQHSQTSTGKKEPTDINALADECLRLSYHGLRAKDKAFNATMHTNFDENIDKINIVPQDISRVLINVINNAFYAVSERQKSGGLGYEPSVSVSTKKINDKVEIRVTDNGNGIPQKIVDKIFQPFFTTKPTGQGTGLGLSLSYDIVKAHGGEIKVESKEGEGSEFIIQLPVV